MFDQPGDEYSHYTEVFDDEFLRGVMDWRAKSKGAAKKTALDVFDDYQKAYDAALNIANQFGRNVFVRKVDEYGKTRYFLSFTTGIDGSMGGEIVEPGGIKTSKTAGLDLGTCFNCAAFGYGPNIFDDPKMTMSCQNPESTYLGSIPVTLRCSLYAQGDKDYSQLFQYDPSTYEYKQPNIEGFARESAKHAGKRLVVSEANSFKLQEHGDGTYDVLDGEGNVVMSQESYQVASNFVEGSPRGEYSETDEVRDTMPETNRGLFGSKTSAREYSPEEIEQARQLGEKAFQEGAIKAPAQDPELLAMLEGNQVGEGIPLLKAWQQGYHQMNADQDVEGWTDEENQALRDARGSKTAAEGDYSDEESGASYNYKKLQKRIDKMENYDIIQLLMERISYSEDDLAPSDRQGLEEMLWQAIDGGQISPDDI